MKTTFTPTWEVWNCWDWGGQEGMDDLTHVNGMFTCVIDPAPPAGTTYKGDLQINGQRPASWTSDLIQVYSDRFYVQLSAPLEQEISLVVTEEEKVVITPEHAGSRVVVSIATQWVFLRTFTTDDCPTQGA